MVMTANRAEATMPKRTSLPSILPPVSPRALRASIAVRLGPVAKEHASDEQNAHHGEHGPALPLIADHAPEHIGQRCAEREDRNDLNVIRQRSWIFQWVRRIGVEKPAAVRAEHLDGDLRGSRTDRYPSVWHLRASVAST